MIADDTRDQGEEGEPPPKKPQWRRERLIALAGAAGLLLIILLGMLSCSPKKGTILYGICSAFLEQMITYPHTIQHTAVEQYPAAVRIYYTQTDAFGQYGLEMIECGFERTGEGQLKFVKGMRNREAFDAETVRRLNLSIPAIVAAKPDLTLPRWTAKFLY